MADYYVKSGAAGTGDGSSWVNAYTTLVAALTGKAAGDRFFVSHQHNESTNGSITLISPGTAASPCQILCVNDGATPPTALATTANVQTSGTTPLNINFQGFAYVYGVTVKAGVAGGSGTAASFGFPGAANLSFWWRLEKCSLQVGATGSGNSINIGNATGDRDGLLELIDTTVSFAAASQIIAPRSKFIWRNTSSALLGTIPTALLGTGVAGIGGTAYLQGVDLSAAGSGKSIVKGDSIPWFDVYLEDCRLNAAVSIVSGTISSQAEMRVTVVNCDSGNTNYQFLQQTYQGTVTHETTIVRSGGATDGTTVVSRKLVSTANSKFFSPLEGPPLLYWIEKEGRPVTFTLPVLTDGVTLTNLDAWLEVEYLGNYPGPLAVTASGRLAEFLQATTNHPTDTTSSWTTTGLAAPVKQSLVATVTPQLKGLVRLRVMLARPTTTLYFDPKPYADNNRQYVVGITGGFVEEYQAPPALAGPSISFGL